MRTKFDYRKLRGKIKEEIGTERDLAKIILITPTTLSNKLKNKFPFDQEEIYKIMDVLNIEKTDIALYFFTKKVGN